jgi:hypothetical protein
MKLLTLTCAVCILFMQNLKSQDSLKPAISQDTISKPVFYRAYIYQAHQSTIKGYLATIQDSSLYISQNIIPLSFGEVNTIHLEKFDYKNIIRVKVAKPHVRSRAVLIGVGAGIIIGALIGYSGGNDTGWFGLTAGSKAFLGGLIGGGAGCLVGAVIGNNAEKKFMINGEWQSLQDMKNSLQIK